MSRLIRHAWLALVFVSLPVIAQDQGLDEGQGERPVPARETVDEQAAEREALEPGVPAAVLAQDVRRRATGGGTVMDEMDLGRTEITGNQELPKVLYIVPWKKSDPGELMGKPVNTLLDEVLAPLDREEFIRRVDYYDDLYTEEAE
jgi:hypothetical protein